MTALTLCQLDDIPDYSSRGFAPGNNNPVTAAIFIIRQRDHLYIYRNHCPHLGVPLEWLPHQFLDRDGQYIQCATHGAQFRITDGICVSGPCPGEALTPVPFRIEGKSIIIDSVYLEQNP